MTASRQLWRSAPRPPRDACRSFQRVCLLCRLIGGVRVQDDKLTALDTVQLTFQVDWPLSAVVTAVSRPERSHMRQTLQGRLRTAACLL